MEIELKLLIAPADLAAFRRIALLKQCATAKPHTLLLRNTYFDTPALYLKEHGMELRVRRTGPASIQTLKADGHAAAGLHQRQEWEARVAGPRPEIESLVALVGAGTAWEKVIRAPGLAQGLVPIFDSVVRRTIWQLRLPHGAEVELALDRGELRCLESREPISEVELELKAGDAGALFDLALQLQDKVRLRVGNLSKSARGYALLAPQSLAAVRAQSIELDADMTVEQGFWIIVGNCLTQMQGNEAGVTRGLDPESIHQMRVGMRRLRSALRLFSKWIPFPQSLQDELAWLGGELGAARDADVLADSTLAKVAAACPLDTELQRLAQSASAMAQEKRLLAAAAVGSTRYSRLMLGLVGWLQASRWQESRDDSARRVLVEPLERHQAKILARCHQKLIERGKRLEHGTPEERHRVRIAAKKLRYATEFFQSLHAAGRVKHYVKSLTALQDALGWLNDAAVADRLLREVEQRLPELAGSASFARGFLRAATNEDMRGLVKLWEQFGAMKPP